MHASERTLSPMIEAYLKSIPPVPGPGELPISELRKRFSERQKIMNAKAPAYPLTIQDESVPTPDGEVPIRIYRPLTEGRRPSVNERCRTLVFFHGGGFVFGDLDSLEWHCREIASFADCMVISVDYPLAPEHPFPAAPHSLYASTNWIYGHLERWKGDPDHFFIAGSSSGANLAAVVCMMIRDQGGAKVAGQVLLCPMVDANFETLSYRENAAGYGIARAQCIWFLSQYAPDSKNYSNPLLAPLRASHFQDLPPALVVTAEFDPLRDEGRAFAKKLQEAGVAYQDLFYRGMTHGFSTLPLELPEKEDVLNKMKDFIQR